MTMSIPPQTNSPMILTEIPADYKVPDYVTVKSMEDKGAAYLLTAADGSEFTVLKDCTIIPYLTGAHLPYLVRCRFLCIQNRTFCTKRG